MAGKTSVDRVPESEFGGDYGLIAQRDHFANHLETASEQRMVAVMQNPSNPAVLPNPDYVDDLTIHELDRYRVSD